MNDLTAAVVVVLVAAILNPVQMTSALTARMYSLGMLLAALSTWFLARALIYEGDRWWIGYGVAAAAFCYTHHFAFFTLFGQSLFVWASVATNWYRGDANSARRALSGWLTATGITVVLYSPWLPVLAFQSAEVWEQFWIPAKSNREIAADFVYWAIGLRLVSPLAIGLAVFGLVWAAGQSWWRGGWAGRFFVTQAVVPWICCLLIPT